jgi:FG-GAP repeat protein
MSASTFRTGVLGLLITAAASVATAQTKGDFNGDGHADVAIGMPFRTVGTAEGAGAVEVRYAAAGSPMLGTAQLLHADVDGVAGEAEEADFFGQALATADFNHDGYADLAVGVPGEDVGTIVDAGAVVVLYGSASGLTGVGSQEWTSDTPGVVGRSESGDFFGRTLAAAGNNGWILTAGGDYVLGGGFLAIGAPYEDLAVRFFPDPIPRNVKDAGAVTVLYFDGLEGLTATDSQEWTENSPDVLGSAEEDDHFGWALAIGFLGFSGEEDLAIGIPGEDVGTIVDAGGVTILYALGNYRLSATGNQSWNQDSPGVPGAAEAEARFGAALAAGTDGLDQCRCGDLAIGIPGQTVDGFREAGAVVILRKDPAAGYAPMTATLAQLWHANVPGVPDTAEMFDNFGATLAMGDFNGDHNDDLAIGAPSEDQAGPWEPGWIQNVGAVTVLYASRPAGGLTTAGSQLWTQGTAGVADNPEEGDRFASALAAFDVDWDGREELIIGVPFEDLSSLAGPLPDVGGFHVLHGSDAGLTTDGWLFNILWTQGTGPRAPFAEYGSVIQ